MADLVPDDIVEHALWSEQQAPVEAHAPGGRTRGPARALRANREAGVRRPGKRGGTIQTWCDLAARGAAVEELDRRPRIALGHEQALAAQMRAAATGLRDELQRAIEIGNRAAAPRELLEYLAPLGQAALDPGAQLAHSGGGGALGRARGQDDLDPGVSVDVDPHATRARGAAHGVGDLASSFEARAGGSGDACHRPSGYAAARVHNPAQMAQSIIRL